MIIILILYCEFVNSKTFATTNVYIVNCNVLICNMQCEIYHLNTPIELIRFGRFCLGAFSNVHRSEASERCRMHIGNLIIVHTEFKLFFG